MFNRVWMWIRNLFLLSGEVPDPPAHVLEPGAALEGVAGGGCLDPRLVEIRLVHLAHHLVHEVPGRVEMRRHLVNGLLLLRRRYGARPAVQYCLQVPVDPLVARHCHKNERERERELMDELIERLVNERERERVFFFF